MQLHPRTRPARSGLALSPSTATQSKAGLGSTLSLLLHPLQEAMVLTVQCLKRFSLCYLQCGWVKILGAPKAEKKCMGIWLI